MSAFKAGLLLIAVLSVGTYLGFAKDIPLLNEPYEIKAAFTDSSGLRPGSPVRVAGVDVGEVTEVEHTSPGSRTVTATFAIRDRGRPVHTDARAVIRPRIFLEGNFFIDLSPGTPSAPEMEEGGIIGTERTENPVQVDEILKALTADTRTELQDIFKELMVTRREGGGEAFNESLRYQPDAYRFTAVVSEALLGERPRDLGRYIRNAGVVAGALDRHPQQLQSLLTDFNATAAAFADRQDDLRAALRELPETLEAAMPTFTALNEAFPPLRAFARAARPGIRSTGPAVDALLPALRQLRLLVGRRELRGLSEDLRGAIPALAEVAQDSVPLLEQQRLAASCFTSVIVPNNIKRIPDEAHPPVGPVYEELVKWLPGLAGESRSFDANGQWFKVLGGGGAETIDLGNGLYGTALSPLSGVNPPPDPTEPPFKPDVPCETQEPPNLHTEPAGPPRGVEGASASNPKVAERMRKARETAILLQKARLRLQGSDMKVLDRDATMKDVEQVAGANGLLEQVKELPKLRARMPKVGR